MSDRWWLVGLIGPQVASMILWLFWCVSAVPSFGQQEKTLREGLTRQDQTRILTTVRRGFTLLPSDNLPEHFRHLDSLIPSQFANSAVRRCSFELARIHFRLDGSTTW